jgi:hypothetical protein
MLSLKLVTSRLKKKSSITFESSINDSKMDEDQTYSNEIRGRGGKKLDTTITHDNIEEKHEPNMDQVITNIQDEPIVYAKLVVFVIKLAAVVI